MPASIKGPKEKQNETHKRTQVKMKEHNDGAVKTTELEQPAERRQRLSSQRSYKPENQFIWI